MELADELYAIVQEALDHHGPYAITTRGADAVLPIDEIIDLLLPHPEVSVVALRTLLESDVADKESLELTMRAILNAAEDLPGLEPLFSDEVLSNYV